MRSSQPTRLTSVDGRLQVMDDLHAGGPAEHSQHIKTIVLEVGDTLLHHRGDGTALVVPLYAKGRWRRGVCTQNPSFCIR